LRARYEELLATADSQAEAWTPPEEETAVTDVRYPLPYPAWEKQIEAALARIAAGDLDKVVLSRVSEIFFSRRVDADAALARLNRHFPHSYRFLFEPRPFHAFLGATPELLARVQGDELTTMALAGTVRTGETAAETAALGQQLLDSAKDRHEHDLVVSSILRRLAGRVSDLTAPETPTLHRVGNLQHLLTPINGRLTHPLGILAVAELLHPTPALGGSPRQKAMAFIRETEPAPRGWYAGPVGWIDHRLNGALAVAIRSAVTQQRRAWLYAGAGVVSGSDPRREWEETGLKFGPMQQALGIVNGQ
jgi:menaquinone-specific isochorismate synthase